MTSWPICHFSNVFNKLVNYYELYILSSNHMYLGSISTCIFVLTVKLGFNFYPAVFTTSHVHAIHAGVSCYQPLIVNLPIISIVSKSPPGYS